MNINESGDYNCLSNFVLGITRARLQDLLKFSCSSKISTKTHVKERGYL